MNERGSRPLTREVVAELRALEAGVEYGPWIVNTDADKIGDNWSIAFFGHDDAAKGNVEITTDHLHASECRSEGGLREARFIAGMRNDAVAILDAAEWALNNGYGEQKMLPLP